MNHNGYTRPSGAISDWLTVYGPYDLLELDRLRKFDQLVIGLTEQERRSFDCCFCRSCGTVAARFDLQSNAGHALARRYYRLHNGGHIAVDQGSESRSERRRILRRWSMMQRPATK